MFEIHLKNIFRVETVLMKKDVLIFTGVCEKYRLLHDNCDPLETMNGHCGCESGLSCQWVPDPTVATSKPTPNYNNLLGLLGKRGMAYHPEPGSYQCA